MEEDWDLHAVVRSCAVANSTARCSSGGASSSSSSSTTTTTDIHPLSNFQPRQGDNSFSFRDPLIFTSNTRVEELHELCKPFIAESPPQRQPLSPPLPVHGVLQNISPQQTLKQEQQQQLNTRLIQHKRPLSSNGSKPGVTLSTQNTRTKRRKNQLKKVCHVASDGLSSDTWCWRKYGQKPIKGSPYPRGYYKCSTSKGCMARKQVERDRFNPNMFIITYTCEHNHPMPTHRNSLAGISRQKTANSETSTVGNSNIKPTNSSPENQESSREEKEEIFEDDDGEFGISNMTLDTLDPDDDFFEGLEELPVAGRGEAVVTGSTNLGQTLYMC